jgi:hypothetical protein
MKIGINSNADLSVLDKPNFSVIPSITEKGEYNVLHATWVQLVDTDNENTHFNVGITVIVEDIQNNQKSVQARFVGLQDVIIAELKKFRSLHGDEAIKPQSPFNFCAAGTKLEVKSNPVTIEVVTASGNKYHKITEPLVLQAPVTVTAISTSSASNTMTQEEKDAADFAAFQAAKAAAGK